jgi:hypothetical protein
MARLGWDGRLAVGTMATFRDDRLSFTISKSSCVFGGNADELSPSTDGINMNMKRARRRGSPRIPVPSALSKYFSGSEPVSPLVTPMPPNACPASRQGAADCGGRTHPCMQQQQETGPTPGNRVFASVQRGGLPHPRAINSTSIWHCDAVPQRCINGQRGKHSHTTYLIARWLSDYLRSEIPPASHTRTGAYTGNTKSGGF